ncbi:hypothetical protein G7Y41_04830 [Schaalia sp. ZJ405]|uniref:hypothetical protein n=1 Tax=Schaalia sp. ZJ405 TaxID=2709403 RepID=UPI0013EAD338|nr:hypothetical protein [Schaalia sp. ZJ405]QPK80453.1 hypothetical protein G7Y41_04830 [Schaalia sp. ZJ405]
MKHTSILGCFLLVAPLLLCSCAGGEKPVALDDLVGKGWHADIEQLRAESRGRPYEHVYTQILDDEKISDEELSEIRARHLTCVEDQGVKGFQFLDSGGAVTGYLENGDSDAVLKIDEQCNDMLGTSFLTGLYHSMVTNPRNVDQNELIAICLRELNVVEPTYTGKQFIDEMEHYMSTHANSEGNVDGDPMLSLSYTVEPKTGADATYRCIVEPQKILDLSSDK